MIFYKIVWDLLSNKCVKEIDLHLVFITDDSEKYVKYKSKATIYGSDLLRLSEHKYSIGLGFN